MTSGIGRRPGPRQLGAAPPQSGKRAQPVGGRSVESAGKRARIVPPKCKCGHAYSSHGVSSCYGPRHMFAPECKCSGYRPRRPKADRDLRLSAAEHRMAIATDNEDGW